MAQIIQLRDRVKKEVNPDTGNEEQEKQYPTTTFEAVKRLVGNITLNLNDALDNINSSTIKYNSDIAVKNGLNNVEQALDRIYEKPIRGVIDFNFRKKVDELGSATIEGTYMIEKVILQNASSIDISYTDDNLNVQTFNIIDGELVDPVVIPKDKIFKVIIHRISEGISAIDAISTILYKII